MELLEKTSVPIVMKRDIKHGLAQIKFPLSKKLISSVLYVEIDHIQLLIVLKNESNKIKTPSNQN